MTERTRIPDLYGPSRREAKRLELGISIVLDPKLRGKRILLVSPTEAKAREEFQRFKELFERLGIGKAAAAGAFLDSTRRRP